ncbi:MAG TPA: peptide-methionine (S)-S-oxide reductase MsrA [Bacteroidales bacterium]|nr:peptide-methionine (S)-S-oxide reductase MsrA [Bacteroidales bacterium]
MEVVTFAAGCFWGVQYKFSKIKGVLKTVVGYTGGTVVDPTYEEVCTGETNHAEAVQIYYDENIISFKNLLAVFWSIHDPTSLNKQGPDEGTQYRSAIFCHNELQLKEALESKKQLELSGQLKKPIVTEIVPFSNFYKAEEYHQDYFRKKGID